MSQYCNKCGKEIPQNSKQGSCEHCQNKVNGNIRKVGMIVLGILGTLGSAVVFVITSGKFGGPKT